MLTCASSVVRSRWVSVTVNLKDALMFHLCTVMQGCSPTLRLADVSTAYPPCFPLQVTKGPSAGGKLKDRAACQSVPECCAGCFPVSCLFSYLFFCAFSFALLSPQLPSRWHCSSWKATSFLIFPHCNRYRCVRP